MRIVLATPLYPPEVAGPALYAKELARRLAERYEITVVTYAHLPETIPGVHIVAVEKHRPLPLRLISYLRALTLAARNADMLYAINGTSVELPVTLVTGFLRTPLLFCIADSAAHDRTQSHFFSRMIEKFVFLRAKK